MAYYPSITMEELRKAGRISGLLVAKRGFEPDTIQNLYQPVWYANGVEI
jgi:hypothetical protein